MCVYIHIYNGMVQILAIHGYRQSDKIFSAKLGSLRKSFKREVDFIFIKAPHRVPTVEHQSNNEEHNDATDDIIERNIMKYIYRDREFLILFNDFKPL